MHVRLLASAAALAAAVALSPAWAQPNDHRDKAADRSTAGDNGRHDRGDRGGTGADAGRGADTNRTTPAAKPRGTMTGGSNNQAMGGSNNQAMGGSNNQAMGGADRRRGYGRQGAAAWSGTNNTTVRPLPGQDRTRAGGQDWRPERSANRGSGRSNVFMGRGSHWGQRVHRNAFANLRHSFRAARRYHAGAYYQPAGWYYRRWSVGAFLPALFFSQNYWLQDYSTFGLTAPPYGTVWIRYGDDALLIDQDTGEVIQVVYGIFY